MCMLCYHAGISTDDLSYLLFFGTKRKIIGNQKCVIYYHMKSAQLGAQVRIGRGGNEEFRKVAERLMAIVGSSLPLGHRPTAFASFDYA